MEVLVVEFGSGTDWVVSRSSENSPVTRFGVFQA